MFQKLPFLFILFIGILLRVAFAVNFISEFDYLIRLECLRDYLHFLFIVAVSRVSVAIVSPSVTVFYEYFKNGFDDISIIFIYSAFM